MPRHVFLALCISAAIASHAVAQQYQITDSLPVSGAAGTPAGAWNWWISGVNSAGQIVGGIKTQTSSRAPYAWNSGNATPLELPPGHIGGVANAVNSQGWIAGTAYSDLGTGTAMLWKNGAATAITIPGQVDSEVTALSNAGHVAGITGLNGPNIRGFVWNDGSLTELQSLGLGGSGQAVASSITSSGLTVGYSETAAGVGTATKWIDGAPVSLGVAGEFSVARDVNESGNIIVGNTDSKAFIIRDGEIEYIEKPYGAVGIQAKAVNETGDVVGTIFYQDPNNRTIAFVYRNGQLIMGSDLFGAPGVVQSQGLEISDDGHVFVIGYDSQFRPKVFELSYDESTDPPPDNGGGGTPGVPEPTSAILLGLAGLGATGWRRLTRR